MARWFGRKGLLVRPYRVIGRFAHLRRAYSWIRSRRGTAANLGDQAGRDDWHRRNVEVGPPLPSATVAEIRGFASSAPCRRPGGRARFGYADVRAGHLADGSAAPIADVDCPDACAAIVALRHDAALLAIARRHLGYRPRHVDVRLYWSFAGDMSDEARRAGGQTIDFHYDVPWYNAVYAYFYLTDTDRRSGAHVVLPGSAADKPLSFILAGCMRDDASLAAYYRATEPLTLEGPAGFCFFEDPYCYHKAIPPVAHDRLMLQFRYH